MQMQAQLRTLAAAFLVAACGGEDVPGSAAEPALSSSGEVVTEASASGTGDVTTTGAAAVCGDGVVEGDEECDDGADNADDAACTAGCRAAVCGDGLAGPGEGCDDGNRNDADACTNACTPAECGDGVVGLDEECDDGDNDNSDGCLTTCKPATCGDGYVQVGVEFCDDGDKDNGDECLVGCKLPECGDGYVFAAGGEVCDDGNVDNSDACLDTCVLAKCGDGYTQVGVEACDDANQVDDDACTNACTGPATCEDAQENGLETDVDCGGPNCAGCLDGEACEVGSDCASFFCDDGLCVTPRHCRDIRDDELATEDGTYPVDPDGPDVGAAPIAVYCEMSFNGGGWTAVFNMREKPVGEASAAAMLAVITQNGPVVPVLPNSNSPAILTGGLDLGQFTEALFGWAPSIQSDVTRYGKLTAPAGLAGLCYLDGYCGAGQEVGEFDLVPNGSVHVLSTGKPTESPHVGLGFDNQTILWGYDRNAFNSNNWGNWNDEVPCCKAGNTVDINTSGWRYVIYLR